MVRPVHRLLPLLLAACLLRLQVSNCSSSLAEEPRIPSGGVHGDVLHHQLFGAEVRTARPSKVAADDRRTSAADHDGEAPSAATTPEARYEGVVASRPRQTTSGRALVRAGLLRPAVLLRSKLARRLLAGVDDEAVTDGAGPSCHSSNVHIKLSPGVEALTTCRD